MDNPFSAPVSKSPITEEKSTPPPLEEIESVEPQTKPEPVSASVQVDTELPPVKEEKDVEAPVGKQGESSLPPQNGDIASPAPVAAETIVSAPEFAESKFDLEDEESEPNAFSVTPAVEPDSKPTPKPVSRQQSPDLSVSSHHQPASYAAPEGWSDADFDSHDGSELPALTMEEKSCRMCKYFHFEDSLRSEVRFGECRRSAPVGVGKAVWPSVLWESWCGEWQMGVGQEEIMQMARSVADSAAFKNS